MAEESPSENRVAWIPLTTTSTLCTSRSQTKAWDEVALLPLQLCIIKGFFPLVIDGFPGRSTQPHALSTCRKPQRDAVQLEKQPVRDCMKPSDISGTPMP